MLTTTVVLPAESYLLKLTQERQSTRKSLDQHSLAITQTQTNLTETQTKLAKTQNDLMGTQATVAQTQNALMATREELSELRKEHNLTKTELLDRAKREDGLRFAAFKANLMTGLVKKLSIQHKVNILKEFRGKNDPLHDSTKYVSAADTPLGKNQAIEFMNRTGLDPAYRVFLENYRSFVKVLHEWVYETDDEFARLFLSRQFQAEPLTIEENVVQ